MEKNTFKIALVGNNSVGKTALMHQILEKPFEDHQPTLGATYMTVIKDDVKL